MHLVDANGNEVPVAIVRVELLQMLAGDQFDIADTYPAQEAGLASVWDDAQLDEYTEQDGSPIE